MSTTEDFYVKLPKWNRFEQGLDEALGQEIPDDWWIALTDVAGSTVAISQGQYRQVNTAGVLALVAVANRLGNMRFPFVFGGDGILMALPPSAVWIRPLLADVRERIAEIYGLELRTAAWQSHAWKKQLSAGSSSRLSVSKFEVTEHYEQCSFYGPWDHLESLFKASTGPWTIQREERSEQIQASFDGYSCRWSDIPSPLGKTLAMIIKPGSMCLQECYTALTQHLGDDFHPLRTEQMRMDDPVHTVWTETQVHGRRIWPALVSLWGWILVWLAHRLGFKLQYQWMDLRQIKELNRTNADYRKFDGTLKIIAISTPEAYLKLRNWLEDAQGKGQLCFGCHVSDRALMTCALHLESEVETHFVDAADGGYALAALELKAQLAKKSQF